MVRPTLKYTNLLIIYDAENTQSQLIFRQRNFTNNNNIQLTPITNKLLERAIPKAFIPRVRAYKPRQFIALQKNPNNISKLSKFTTIIPFLPGSEDFKIQAKEILELDTTECVEYDGEDRR